MTIPRVSVLIPVFNGRRYLPETMESVLGQTFGDFECLVTDDGSTDGTWELLSELARRDARIHLWRNEQNLGITRSMNWMFAQAQGVYLTRHDADDLSLPERFGAQVAFLEANPAVGVVGTLVDLIDSNGALLDMDYFPRLLTDEEIQESLLAGNCLCQGSVMFRRTCLERVGYYDEAFLSAAEDYDMWLRLAEVTQLVNLPTPLYKYRYYPDSNTYRPQVQRILDTHAAAAIRRAVHRRYGPNPPLYRLLPPARYLLRAAIVSLSLHDLAAAQGQLSEALALYPPLFGTEAVAVEIFAPYLGNRPTEDSIAFIGSIFRDVLPQSRLLSRLKSRWLAQLHMREVFDRFGRGDARQVLAHLWHGVRYDPRWLLNRGVLSIAARSALRPRRGNGLPDESGETNPIEPRQASIR